MQSKKPTKRITVTVQQACRAIQMCQSNAYALMSDALLLWTNDRIMSVPILIQFAFEEYGKAKIIQDVVNNNKGSDKLKLNIDHLTNHRRKSNAFVQLLKQAQKKDFNKGVLFSRDPRENAEANKKYGFPFLKKRARQMLELIEKSHNSRLEASFVDFDRVTGEPKYGHTLDKMQLKSMVDAYRDVKDLLVFPPI